VESREETSKYTDTLEDGTSAQVDLGDGCEIRHHLAQPAIADHPWPRAAVITGLAWSGRGAIDRVDVSLDGGMNWQQARMSKPSRDKALQPLLPTNRLGRLAEMLLQSRAMDETGYVQPTKAMLREVRGLNSIYHNNCIQTWGSTKPERPKMWSFLSRLSHPRRRLHNFAAAMSRCRRPRTSRRSTPIRAGAVA
jgi:sulfane dehydrogenase subunit SoxC